MKKTLITAAAVILMLSIIFAFCACSGAGSADDGTLETADSTINVTNDAGTVSLTEETAKAMLGAFDKEVLGLEKEFEKYTLKLSQGTVLGGDACIVEAFDGDAAEPAQQYAIIGYNCFILDKASGEYFIMTKDGSFPVSVNTAESETAENGSDFKYDADNHRALLAKFKKYTAAQLGTEKEITEYILVTQGNMSISADGETVYTVFLYEKDGMRTDYMLAFNENNVYAPDENGVFEKLG